MRAEREARDRAALSIAWYLSGVGGMGRHLVHMLEPHGPNAAAYLLKKIEEFERANDAYEAAYNKEEAA